MIRQVLVSDALLAKSISRNDLHVSVAGLATPTPFGFGGCPLRNGYTSGHSGYSNRQRHLLTPCHSNSFFTQGLDGYMNYSPQGIIGASTGISYHRY